MHFKFESTTHLTQAKRIELLLAVLALGLMWRLLVASGWTHKNPSNEKSMDEKPLVASDSASITYTIYSNISTINGEVSEPAVGSCCRVLKPILQVILAVRHRL